MIDELFGELNPATADRLNAAAPRCHLAAGETLFRQGQPGDCMYILVSGRLRALVAGADGLEESVAELAPTTWVGELSLLTQAPRSATVQAIRDTELIQITAGAFEEMVREDPGLALQMARTVTAKLQLMIRQPRPESRLKIVALVPLSDGAPLADTTARLESTLNVSGRALRLNASLVDEALGQPVAQDDIDRWDDRDSLLANYLSRVEREHDFVLLEADEGWSAWTRRCLRSADLILLVAGASSSPQTNAIHDGLFGSEPYPVHATMELLLLHREGQPPGQGTAGWLDRCPVQAHMHLRARAQPDFERLARRLNGAEVALCLSGGGARGFVHIGVIQAMEEANIPIDRVSGTSMGAVIGAMLAGGRSVAEMIELSHRGWHKMKATQDYTLPIVSLLRGGRVGKMLAMMFGEGCIEDLWLPFFAVSSNLTRAQEVVHRKGRLREALRASISVPGLAPPVPRQGDLLVDGAVLNNLPADIRARSVHGRTIAVDANPAVDLRAESDYGPSLSAGRLLISRLNPFIPAIRAPNLLAIIDRVAYLNSVRQADALDRDERILYMHPPTNEYGLMDFNRIREIVRVGYEHARPILESWEKD